jgi:ABC-2 type transport system ATP-binding protein
MHEPRVLFLDEPTTGLDPMSRINLWEEVRRLNTELGTTVFLTTQYLEEADALAHRVAIIDHGRIVRDGAPAQLKAAVGCPTLLIDVDRDVEEQARDVMARFGATRSARSGRVAIGLTDGAAAMADVVRALDQAGIEVTHMELDAPSLDDVFAEATGRRLEGAAEAGEVTEPVPDEPAPPGRPGSRRGGDGAAGGAGAGRRPGRRGRGGKA